MIASVAGSVTASAERSVTASAAGSVVASAAFDQRGQWLHRLRGMHVQVQLFMLVRGAMHVGARAVC